MILYHQDFMALFTILSNNISEYAHMRGKKIRDIDKIDQKPINSVIFCHFIDGAESFPNNG